MVEFEEIKDEHYEDDDGFVDDDEASDDDYSDTSSTHEDDISEESIFDRIVALKDIIPQHQRFALSRAISKTVSYGSMATYIGGKAVYIAMTSILMLGIPYALAVEEEKAISEQERQMQMQQGMSEV
jgi:mitochondrial import receptor subunit TOM22